MSSTEQPKTSTGGLIAAGIMTVLSLITLINVYNREHRLDWPMTLGYVGGAGVLFWRAFRPPLGFGQGVLTWFGGMIAGGGAGSVVFFLFQATRPTIVGRLLIAAMVLALCLAAGWVLLKLGSRPPGEMIKPKP